MTYGIDVTSSDSKTQISSENPIYVCVYSGIHESSIRINGLMRGDVVAFTFTGTGNGGVYGYQTEFTNGFTLKGSHRVVVFRSSNLVAPPTNPFGVEVYSNAGELTFSSSFKPMLVAERLTPGTYHGLVFQGATIRWVRFPNNVMVYADAKWVKPNGNYGVTEYYLNSMPGAFSAEYIYNTADIFLDITAIPLVYNLGAVSIT